MAACVPTDAEILDRLKSSFGFSDFRPLQREIVSSILGGQDVVALMPTGGGKSLCYQFPALLLDGVTVVVSPLIALMKDQVDRLGTMGIAATYINSSLELSQIRERQAAASRGAIKLLYVAPERLMSPRLLRLLSSIRVALFAIDEAHCISEWGHDFRPEYRELRRLRELFPSTPLAAFTATATRRVQADMVEQLALQGAASFRGGFNRANLLYDVRPKQDAYRQLADYLRGRRDASGIIYCLARAGTESLAERLRADGLNAAAYHAGLETDERRRRQEAFIGDDVRIIVATIAFGMGIDKPDVRFVVHYDLPKNLEAYYQESGRAGRDGEPSDCILFYSYGDAIRYERFIRQKPSETEREIAVQQLRQMVDWAASRACRRRALLAYFDERLDGQSAPCCDVCNVRTQGVDCTVPAQMFLSCVKRTGERFSVAHVISVLRGSRKRRVLQLRHDTLSTYGLRRDRSREEWQHLARELLRAGHIRQADAEYGAVKVTERGRAVLFRGERVMLPTMRERTSRPAAAVRVEAPRRTLFERLRALRKCLADERDVPPYVIFYNATLEEMVSILPTTRDEIRSVLGVGEQKLRDFGDAFLAVISEYVRETGARPAARAPDSARIAGAPTSGRISLTSTVRATLELFRGGNDLPAIAIQRGLALSTVEGHLATAMEAGEIVELNRLVGERKVRAIHTALEKVGHAALSPVMEELGDGYTYAECRFVRATLGWPPSSTDETNLTFRLKAQDQLAHDAETRLPHDDEVAAF